MQDFICRNICAILDYTIIVMLIGGESVGRIEVQKSETSDKFSLAFDGGNEIEAAVLGLTLSNLSFVVGKIVEEDPTELEHELMVQTFEQGSFIIDFILSIARKAQEVIPHTGIDSLDDAKKVVDVFKGMLDIKAQLKGQKPKKIEEKVQEGYIRVTTPDGTEVTAPLGSKIVINNPQVDKSISEIAQGVRLHNPDGGLRLIRDGNTTSYSRDEIQDIGIQTHNVEMSDTERISYQRIALPIKKLDLLGNGAWTFRYGKRSISASFEDKVFLKAVHEGKISYKAGDKLDVDLRIETKIAPDNTLLKESHIIEKVYGVVPAPEQQKIQ